jgi:ferredoxin-NADP reductase
VSPDPPTWLTATVVDTEQVSAHSRILRLKAPGWPGNLPGQHVDVRLTAEDGYQATRSYSLASSGTAALLELAVDELPDGEVSPYLVEDVREGDQLEIRGPIGAYFVWTPEVDAPVQLIAGGSGVVPLAAIARAHAGSGSPALMRLLYSVRSRPDAFFADELDALVGDVFEIEWVYTRSAPAGDTRVPGRLDAARLSAAVFPSDMDPLTFVCGPTRFVETVADLLVAAGHDPARIRTERFGGA